MFRNWYIAAISFLVTVVLVQACAPKEPPALDLTQVRACASEDGAGESAYPCVFDGQTAYEGPIRWLLYVDGECPTQVLQPRQFYRCFDVREWTANVKAQPAA